MPELSDEDKAVIDPKSVEQFEAQDDPNDPPQDPPVDPPQDPPADPPPETRTIEIDGVMQELPVAVADAIEAERARIEEQRRQLEQERESMTQKPEHQDPPSDDGFDERFWSDPRSAIREEVNRTAQQVREEMAEEQRKKDAQQQFWTDFYGRYPELKSDEDIVEMTMNRNWDEFSKMEVSKAMDELAKRAAQRIGKTLTSRQGDPSQHRTATEPANAGGDAPPSAPPANDDEPSHKSLSALLKERRAKRQQAG